MENKEPENKVVTYIALLTSVVMLSVSVSVNIGTDMYVKNELNRIDNDIKTLSSDISNSENSREEDYEKRFEELADRIKAIESEADWAKEEIIENYEDEPEEQEETVLDTGWEYDICNNIPACDTNTFRCMDYRTLTNHASDQWKLQEECYTDYNTGIRYYIYKGEKYLCAALGSAYTETIGDSFVVTLNNGYSFKVINGDFKCPFGTVGFYGHDDINYDGEHCINLVEFIFDKDAAPKSVLNAGTMSILEEFGGLYGDGGNIVDIRYLGKVWNI